MKRAGGRTVPVLVTDRETFTESTAILDFAERAAPRPGAIWPLDPSARADAERMVAELDTGLGVASRVLAYDHLLPRPDAFLVAVGRPLSAGERVLVRGGLPLLAPLIRRRFGVGREGARAATRVVDAAFDRAAVRLGRSGGFLVGDAVSGADFSFAALASPLLLPPEHPVYDGTRLELLPPAFRDEVVRLRAHPAGRHALRVYAEFRGAPRGWIAD